MNEDISKAIDIVKNGGIVIFPTDTAFGIGCRIDRHNSVDRLFRIRKRPATLAMPILVNSIAMALTYFDQSSVAVRRLMDEYWPGALTIVAKCKKDLIYSPIRAGGDTVGQRLPNHQIPQALISSIGVPIVGSSANFHGLPTPYRMKDLDPQLIKLVDYVVPGECPVGFASTVVDCTKDPFIILRQGAVQL